MYSFKGRVRYSETDSNENLTLIAILNYFQDCSTFHSEDLGVGMDVLKEMGHFWVLNYWQIDVYRYPYLCEEIEIGTQAYDCRGFLGYRNFYMNDKDGKRAAAANTLWTYLDMESSKPMHIPEKITNAYGKDEKLDMDYEPRKIKFPEDAVKREEEPFEVKRQHLDANNHVNNGQYVQMALDYLKSDLKVDRMRAEYKMQALLGDMVYPVIYEADDYTAVSLNKEDGNPYAVVEFKCLNWENIKS